jgi:ATP-dependent RNA helicase DDX10/DBP4
VTSALQTVGIPIKKLTMNQQHAVSVSNNAATLLVSRPECRDMAKKAFTGYLKALQLLPDKNRINIKDLNVDAFATSLGLPFTPEVPLISKAGLEGRDDIRDRKNVNRKLDKLRTQMKEAREEKKRKRDGGEISDETTKVTKVSKPSEAEDFFTVKQVYEWAKETISEPVVVVDDCKKSSKPKALKIDVDGKARLANGGVAPKKMLFNENDDAIDLSKFDMNVVQGSSEINEVRMEEYLQKVKQRVDAGRQEDLMREKERIQKKHKDKRLAGKGPKAEEEQGVVLDNAHDFDDASDVQDEKDSHSNGSEKSSNESGDSGDDYDDEDDSNEVDVKQQELLALQMLRSNKRRV